MEIVAEGEQSGKASRADDLPDSRGYSSAALTAMTDDQKRAHERLIAALPVRSVIKVDARASGDFKRDELVYHRKKTRGRAFSFRRSK